MRHLPHDPLKKILATKLVAAAQKLGASLSEEDAYAQLVLPPKAGLGDLAFGAFRLSQALKLPPPEVAKRLLSELDLRADLAQAQAAGPYLNFTLANRALGEQVADPARNGSLFQRPLLAETPKTMVEFSQPNTHKELHVGHMRNLCLGDAVVRLLRHAGVEVIATTFPGDMGTHVAKCLWFMKNHNQEAIPEKDRGEWLGRMYSRANILLEDEAQGPRAEQHRAELTRIIQQLEDKKGEYYDLWLKTRTWSIELMEQVYRWAGVKFDRWYWESEVDASSVAWVKDLYEQGKLILSEGAVGMDLNDEGLGFCLLLKKDGTGLYATKDLELARRKFQDFKIEKNIYVVDVRQALHFKQVFKVLERLGFSQAKDCLHLQYNFVELPDGAMSSRKGNIVPIMDLIEQMQDLVRTQYLSRYADDWSEAEIQRTAEVVAQGAIKYGMLRIDTNKKIVFDMREWLKLDGESGPFIQYSYARIASLDRKLGYDPKAPVDWSLLHHAAEHQMLAQLMHFNSVLAQAAIEDKPALVCNYLYDTAKLFNVFYHECPIGSADSKGLRDARLALSAAVGEVLKKGLSLLGIPVPERM